MQTAGDAKSPFLFHVAPANGQIAADILAVSFGNNA
jgi:hypothetical protein